MKLIACCSVFLLFPLRATQTEIQSGTVVIIYFSQEKAVVGTDSRASFNNAPQRDDECKLVAPNNRFLFATVNIAAYTNPTFPILNWDSKDEMRKAYNEVLGGSTVPPADFMERVALNWGNRVRNLLTQTSLMSPTEFMGYVKNPHQVLSTGVFVGKNANGPMQIIGADIIYEESALPHVRTEVKYQTCTADICALGDVAVADEFANLTSSRAKKDRDEWKPPATIPKEDWDILRVIRLVDLTIAFDESGLVGGNVDAAQINKDGSIRWYQLQKNCRAD
jgi:hypothetical protein